MKLGHIVKNRNDTFKYDNGLYGAMPSRVIVFCSWKFTICDGVQSISPMILNTTL